MNPKTNRIEVNGYVFEADREFTDEDYRTLLEVTAYRNDPWTAHDSFMPLPGPGIRYIGKMVDGKNVGLITFDYQPEPIDTLGNYPVIFQNDKGELEWGKQYPPIDWLSHGVVKRGTFNDLGTAVGWYVDADKITDGRGECTCGVYYFVSEFIGCPILAIRQDGVDVYLRGVFSQELTDERRRAMKK